MITYHAMVCLFDLLPTTLVISLVWVFHLLSLLLLLEVISLDLIKKGLFWSAFISFHEIPDIGYL